MVYMLLIKIKIALKFLSLNGVGHVVLGIKNDN